MQDDREYRDLYEWAPVAYNSVGIDGRIRKVNQRTVEMLGYSRTELVGRRVLDLYAETPAGKPKARALFKRFLEGEDIRDQELEMCRADGRTVWVSLTATPIRDRSGRVVASRSVAVDITGRKQVERVLADEARARHNHEEIIGRSPALRDVLTQVGLVAPTDSTMLLLGETGTGKELICRAIHESSSRRGKPLVALNCAAVPSGLVESELFGHEKGAFTGAIAQRSGRFELAHRGTLFLDEIGDVPLETQPKLLRILEEHTFQRVGGVRPIKVDVRVVAATHRDLKRMVEEGRFRDDLFYRLNIFPLVLPSLRDRSSDIRLLAYHFASRISARLGRPPCDISEAALQRLQAYPWPGNVRELENVIERAVILSGGRTIEPWHVHVEEGGPPPAAGRFKSLRDVETAHILEGLRTTRGRVSGPGGAASLLGLKPTTLESRMKKLGIHRKMLFTGPVGNHDMT